jgi:DNA-binding NarL/FixJ family response regulator
MQSIQVFVSEGHTLHRSGIKALLKGEPDMEVVGEAGDAWQTEELCKQLNPNVLLLDAHISGPKPREILDFLDNTGIKTSVIVLVDGKEERSSNELRDSRLRGFFQKNDSEDRLFRAIRVVNLGGVWPDKFPFEDHSSKTGKRLIESGKKLLTFQEVETLHLVEQGLNYSQVSQRMGISHRTVRYHINEIMKILNVHKCLAAVMIALEQGWIQPSQHSDALTGLNTNLKTSL